MAINTKEVKDHIDDGIPADDTVVLVQKTNGDYEKTTILNLSNASIAKLGDNPLAPNGTYTPTVTNWFGSTFSVSSVDLSNWRRYGDTVDVQVSFVLVHDGSTNNAGVYFTLPTNKEGDGGTIAVINAVTFGKKILYCRDTYEVAINNDNRILLDFDKDDANLTSQTVYMNVFLTYEVKVGE